jgi:hypothetical protein
MTEPQAPTATGWLDNFVDYLKQALEIVQLKEDAIDRARVDDEAFTMGLVIIALAGIGMAVGSMFPFGVVAFPVMFAVFAFVFAAIVHLVATMVFKGQGEFIEFFRPYSLAHILLWVNVVWVLNLVLGWIAGIWLLVVTVLCVERAYRIERAQAIATVAIPVAVLFVLAMMFFAVLGAALFFAAT